MSYRTKEFLYLDIIYTPTAQNCTKVAAILQRFGNNIAANSILYGYKTNLLTFFLKINV